MGKKLLTDSEIISGIMTALQTTAAKFSKVLGYKKPSTIYNIVYGQSSISEAMIEAVTKAYPNISREYIEYGIGDPLNSEVPLNVTANSPEEQMFIDMKIIQYKLNKAEKSQKVNDAKLDKIQETLDKIFEILTNTNN